jgi:hypothetical protein
MPGAILVLINGKCSSSGGDCEVYGREGVNMWVQQRLSLGCRSGKGGS